MRKKTKTTPKKSSPKKTRAKKSHSIRTKKVAVKPKAEDGVLGTIKNAFDDTFAKIKMRQRGRSAEKRRRIARQPWSNRAIRHPTSVALSV
jgi:hypothetical protein